jgi:hypothetical protein
MKAAAVLVLASLLQGALGSGSGSGSSSWENGMDSVQTTGTPPSPPPPVAITMTIPGDVAAITSNATVKAAFEAAFATDIATHLNISATRITVTSIAAGSIVVTYSIAPDAITGQQVNTAAVQTTLATPITFTTIKNSAAIPSSITAAYASPVTATGITATVVLAPEPEPEPEPSSGTITLDKSGVESIQITMPLVLAPMIVLTMLHN